MSERLQPGEVLTIEKLKAMPPRTIFASGTATDNLTGLNMSGSGALLRWVAVRGAIHDWAIYVLWASRDEEWVYRHGEKVHTEESIKKLVPCEDSAYAMYRR